MCTGGRDEVNLEARILGNDPPRPCKRMPAYWMPCVLPPRNDIVHHSHGVESSQLKRGKLAREPTAVEMKSALPLARIRHDLRHSSIPSEGERARQGAEGNRETAPLNRTPQP